LIAIAIAIEAKYLRQLARTAAGRAITTATIVMLCLGEALALTVLPVPVRDEDSGTRLGGLTVWHGYFAFILSLQASFIALILLLKALMWQLGQKEPGCEDRRGNAGPVLAAVPQVAEGVGPVQDTAPAKVSDHPPELPGPREPSGSVLLDDDGGAADQSGIERAGPL